MKKNGYSLLGLIVLYLFFGASVHSAFAQPGDVPVHGILNQNFSEAQFPPIGWSSHDLNGDGFEWFSFGSPDDAFEGENSAASESYDNNSGEALEPDNWLITPPLYVQEDDILQFWFAAQDANLNRERLSVYINSGSNNPEDFLDNGSKLLTATTESDEWQQAELDLDDHTGEHVYIAFRHHDTTDQFMLKLDDITGPLVMKYVNSFALNEPEDGSVLEVDGSEDREYVISWEEPDNNLEDELSYTWHLDEESSDFSDPLLSMESDNDGSASQITFTYSELDEALADLGVQEGEVFNGEWTVTAGDEEINEFADEPFALTLTRVDFVSADDELSEERPGDIILEQNYPNPFNPVTRIQYEIPEHQHVRLAVYDVTGRLVNVLVDEVQQAGAHTANFDGSDLSTGTYIYRLEAGDAVRTRQMTFIK